MSGEQHLADARRRAEEALAEYDRLWGAAHATNAYGRAVVGLASALRALLAAGPEAKAPGHDRIAELESLLRECNAVCLCGCPDSEHESYGEDGESCADEEHECIRVAPAVLEIVQRYRVALSDALRAQPTPPPSDAVAAPKAARPKGDIWDACGCPNPDDCEHVFYEPAPSDAAVREAAAPTTYCPDCSVQGTTAGCWTLRLCDQHRIDVSFVSLTPPPAGAEVREAAEVVRTILTAHDARLSESGVLTYGPPSKGTGFVAAIQWLRRYDAARGGE